MKTEKSADKCDNNPLFNILFFPYSMQSQTSAKKQLPQPISTDINEPATSTGKRDPKTIGMNKATNPTGKKYLKSIVDPLKKKNKLPSSKQRVNERSANAEIVGLGSEIPDVTLSFTSSSERFVR